MSLERWNLLDWLAPISGFNQKKAARFVRLLEIVENMRLLELAESRNNGAYMTAFEK